MKYTYRRFKDSEFDEVFHIFLKFQNKTKIKTFYNLTKGRSPLMCNAFLREELKKILKNSVTYLGEEDGKTFAFACFSKSKFRKDSLDLLIVCKNPSYRFNFSMKKLLIDVFQDAKRHCKVEYILASLGPRDKFSSYKNFIKRIFKPEIIRNNVLNRTIIKFND